MLLLGNAPCSRSQSIEELIELNNDPSVDFVYTNIMSKKCAGNDGLTYLYDPDTKTSYNRIGLKSYGWFEYYKDEIVNIEWNKPLFIPVCADSFDILKDIENSCSSRKISIELEFEYVLDKSEKNIRKIINTAYSLVRKTPMGIRVDTNTNNKLMLEILKKINIAFVRVCGNYESCATEDSLYPCGFLHQTIVEYTTNKKFKIGGIQTHQLAIELCKLYSSSVGVIACGGIFSTDDILEFAKVGAIACTIGTFYQQCGLNVFKEIKAGETNPFEIDVFNFENERF